MAPTRYGIETTTWSRFTGGEPTRIHHLDRDPEFLIELPSGVQILRIRSAHGNTGAVRLA